MAALLLGEDGLEQNVLTLQLTDVLFDPFAFLHGRFVNGQLLVVLQGIQLVVVSLNFSARWRKISFGC